jgi:hypothetical protein
MLKAANELLFVQLRVKHTIVVFLGEWLVRIHRSVPAVFAGCFMLFAQVWHE